MKKHYAILTFTCLCFFAQPIFCATGYSTKSVVPSSTNMEAEATTAAKTAKEDWNKLSKKEKRAEKKAIKKQLKEAIKNFKNSSASDTETLLLVIIAILLPPLAMALYDGISSRFWISLLLTLLFYIPGLIYTLVIILGGK